MRNPLLALLDIWLCRYWTADPVALARLGEARPAIVITGASEGIGLALAERFAGAGQPMLLIARQPELLAAAATRIAERTRLQTIPLALDITAPDAADIIAATLASHGLYADILVNNAGIGLGGPFISHEVGDITRLIDLNVRALTVLMRRVVPDMCVRGRGGILNIASLGGYAAGPNQAAYYASKAYVVSLTRAVAWETRGLGVRVAVVAPGPVETRFHAKMGADTAFYRYLLRGMSAAAVAGSAWRGFRWGHRVILPGLATPVLALAMKLSPGILTLPIIGLLLQRRGVGNAGHK